MKKLLLAIVACFALSACGPHAPSQSPTELTVKSEVVAIQALQQVPQAALSAYKAGLINATQWTQVAEVYNKTIDAMFVVNDITAALVKAGGNPGSDANYQTAAATLAASWGDLLQLLQSFNINLKGVVQ